jgi:hypothetical protein
MNLPRRVTVGWFGVIFWTVFTTILSLAVAFGPSTLIWIYLLRPESFFARLVSVCICGVIFIPMGVAAFFLWAYIVSETTGL